MTLYNKHETDGAMLEQAVAQHAGACDAESSTAANFWERLVSFAASSELTYTTERGEEIKTRLVTANKAAAELKGCPVRELAGRSTRDVYKGILINAITMGLDFSGGKNATAAAVKAAKAAAKVTPEETTTDAPAAPAAAKAVTAVTPEQAFIDAATALGLTKAQTVLARLIAARPLQATA